MSKLSRQSAVIDALSQGEYSYASALSTGLSRTGGANNLEYVIDNSAGSKDVFVSWVRYQCWTASAATDEIVTLALYKLQSGESTPTWNTASIQSLRDSGRLMFLKSQFQPKLSTAGARTFMVEKHNIKIRVGEKLCFCMIFSTTVSDAVYGYVLEKRLLEVGT